MLFFSEFYPIKKFCYLNEFTFEHYKDPIIETSIQSKLRREKQCMARCFRDGNVWNSEEKKIWSVVNNNSGYKKKRYTENLNTGPIQMDCLKTKSSKYLNIDYDKYVSNLKYQQIYDINEYNSKYIFAIEHVYPKSRLIETKFYQDSSERELGIKPIQKNGDLLYLFPVNLNNILKFQDPLNIPYMTVPLLTYMLFNYDIEYPKSIKEAHLYEDFYNRLKAINFIISNYKWACVLCNSLKGDHLV